MWSIPFDLDFAFPVDIIRVGIHVEGNLEQGVQVSVESLLDFLELVHKVAAWCTLRLRDLGESVSESILHPSNECEVDHASTDAEALILENVREL